MTIDHKSTALGHLEEARRLLGAPHDEALVKAQVHATLAVAEQARIANLIAVLATDSDLLLEGWGSATNPHLVRRIDDKNRLRKQISDGLGI